MGICSSESPLGLAYLHVSGRTRELASSFEGLKEAGLVGFSHAFKLDGLISRGGPEKSMTPSEGCRNGDNATRGGLPDAQSLAESQRHLHPAILFPKVSQRTSSQGVESLSAFEASKTLQAVRFSPFFNIFRLAIVALSSGVERTFNDRDNFFKIIAPLKRLSDKITLLLSKVINECYKIFESVLVHKPSRCTEI
jgi:hypothetical protein